MPDRTPATRICAYCDGFPVVAVTTGTRLPDGTRATLPAHCPACRGTGTTPHRTATPGPLSVGR